MNSWKDRFIIYTFIVIIFIAFVLVAVGISNKEQPSIEDVMTNSVGLEDYLEK